MSGFQVGPQTFITIRYQVFDAEGDAASVPEVLGYVFGMGGLLPAVERVLDGKVTGDHLRVRLTEQQAYGARNPRGILEVDRADFPDDVVPGDRFEVENEEGGILILHVLDVQADMVVVDTNHPLAGQAVEIAIEVMDVRPASDEEVEGALACLEDDRGAIEHDRIEHDQDLTEGSPVRPDVAVNSLIRRRPGM